MPFLSPKSDYLLHPSPAPPKKKPITQWDTFYLPLVCPGGVPYEDWIVPSLLREAAFNQEIFPFHPHSAIRKIFRIAESVENECRKK
ncbi:hypothetical protein CEXT_475231 [Caerostris extrusa]|uniref:Uncharacterized protein n=1 Tax=Caerostris extrusa TaxID=172846 RepID=A0AAV4SRU9_CAEEX|nr:hypothetical protein CEXT_475231 [Caerostris extrusa]